MKRTKIASLAQVLAFSAGKTPVQEGSYASGQECVQMFSDGTGIEVDADDTPGCDSCGYGAGEIELYLLTP